MKPDIRANNLLSITRSKAKMYEFQVPENYHIAIPRDPARLFALSLGLLGDYSAIYWRNGNNGGALTELKQNLQFSARFFDAYKLSHLNENLHPYLILVGSATYYLCDLPGSSRVLSKDLVGDCPDMDCEGLEDMLLWLLQADYSSYFDGSEGIYGPSIDNISRLIIDYFDKGVDQTEILSHADNLRNIAYINGTPRQLLFADIISAIVKKRIENSTWYSLPQYSDLPTNLWSRVLEKESFVRELWPAQHLLGIHGVFKGKSAIVQMPTSAGKTKAIEIVIRSAFIAGRASLAVIVAPYRALCHEINGSLISSFAGDDTTVNELSDVLQKDYDIETIISGEQILVVTPEKLLYILRHTPSLSDHIGIIIYDEGHQFDSGTRGITYELLLSALKRKLPESIQIILASAVISNADSINEWLISTESDVVTGTNLIPTFKTIAFTSWPGQLGRLEYVAESDIDSRDFFVPRVIERIELNLKPRERKERYFPDKDNSQSIALFLGLKLVYNGGVAIFCGRKTSARKLCELAIDVYSRGVRLELPTEYSNQEEIEKLYYLQLSNLGENAVETLCARMGIFAHHGNTPHGIRLAVEHAMKVGHIRFVICTSTLAQGVNLPIRYLIVSSVYQGADQIKVRDFHNLVGRAGRAGMHTEGSIIFADPQIYDKRRSRYENWRWMQAKDLLEPKNSEPCVSTLSSLFEPIHSADHRYTLTTEPLWFTDAYIKGEDELIQIIEDVVSRHGDKGFTTNSLKQQFEWRLNIISSIESYLMASLEEAESGIDFEEVEELSRNTLAYYLADDEQKNQILRVFEILARNIEDKVPELQRRVIYGKTLYGVALSQEIEVWVREHIDGILGIDDINELLKALWPIISKIVQNKQFRNCEPQNVLLDIGLAWIQGSPFYVLYELIKEANAKYVAGSQRRRFTLNHVVDVCENALSYDGALVIGAITELAEMINPSESVDLITNLQILQKRVKYGLSNIKEIILYEMGFADRCIAIELASLMENGILGRNEMLLSLRQNEDEVRSSLSKYPSYFILVYENIVE